MYKVLYIPGGCLEFLNHQLYVYKNRWSLCVCKFKSQILATAQNNVMSDHFKGLDLKVCCCVLKGVREFANHIGICLCVTLRL